MLKFLVDYPVYFEHLFFDPHGNLRDSNLCTVESMYSHVRLQITTGGYMTKHGQANCTNLIKEFIHIEHVQADKKNSSMNSERIA